MSPLAVAASYNQSAQVAIPLTAQSANGTFYLFVVTNDQGTQPVSTAATNVSLAQTVAVTVPALPDLTASGLGLPASGFTGQQVNVSWTDANGGTAAATGPWTDNIYLASDAQGHNAMLVARVDYPELAGRRSVNGAADAADLLPSTPGTYYLEVVADASGINKAPVCRERHDDGRCAPHGVSEPLPDLIVSISRRRRASRRDHRAGHLHRNQPGGAPTNATNGRTASSFPRRPI